jgi:hypothetical protein
MNHLIFNIREIKSKTNVYDVISNYDKSLLGKIYWHSPWRQYVFEPNREVPTIWSDDCLLDLFNFLHKLKEERNKGIISIDPYNGNILKIKKFKGDNKKDGR